MCHHAPDMSTPAIQGTCFWMKIFSQNFIFIKGVILRIVITLMSQNIKNRQLRWNTQIISTRMLGQFGHSSGSNTNLILQHIYSLLRQHSSRICPKTHFGPTTQHTRNSVSISVLHISPDPAGQGCLYQAEDFHKEKKKDNLCIKYNFLCLLHKSELNIKYCKCSLEMWWGHSNNYLQQVRYYWSYPLHRTTF